MAEKNYYTKHGVNETNKEDEPMRPKKLGKYKKKKGATLGK